MNYEERLANLDRHIAEGTLIRDDWGDGINQACLLVAIAPECAAHGDTQDCPTDVMPTWLADCIPYIDDKGSIEAWYTMIERFAKLAHKWHTFSPETWERIKWRWLGESIVVIAYENAENHLELRATIEEIQVLCRSAASGKNPSKTKWAQTRNSIYDTVHYSHLTTDVLSAIEAVNYASSAMLYTASVSNAFAAIIQTAPCYSQLRWEHCDRMTNDLFNIIEAEIEANRESTERIT